MRYALVKLDRSVSELAEGLTYAVPERYEEALAVGSLVSVPLRQDKALGVVMELHSDAPPFAVRPVTTLLDDDFGPILLSEQLALIDWLAEHYLTSWAVAFGAVLPPIARIKTKSYLRLSEQASDMDNPSCAGLSEMQRQVLQFCREASHQVAVDQVYSRFGSAGRKALTPLLQQGWLCLEEVGQARKPPRSSLFALTKDLVDVSPGKGRIALLWQRLIDDPATVWTRAELQTWPEYDAALLRKLLDKGLLCIYQEKQKLSLPMTLTSAQQEAMTRIEEEFAREDARTVLLHGVTGSGKTEIYLQLIAKTLAQGKTCLVLVPEITLTVQLMERFRARFGEDVVVMHSGLSDAERALSWRRVRRGEARVIVGARSAVFAPLNDLGLVILDEEHEQTFKNEEDPKYHAREVALWRAKWYNARVLFGSATPALESYYSAEQGAYCLVSLMERVQARPLAAIELVDMRRELKEGCRSIFSRALQRELGDIVARKEQAILFHNRRGYHRMTLCRTCGFVLECPDCEIPLIEHLGEDSPEGASRLKCHTCGFQQDMPQLCPNCGSKYLRFFGIGTEKVVEECQKLFPEARILRLDADSTSRKGTKAAIVRSFSERQAEILVGTQMVAKGLDFPAVTLVGVLSADSLLRAPDYRGAERAFSLLTQVSGRAGRGELPGKVVLQSYAPEHPLVQAVQDQDYQAFYQAEIARRQRRQEPPFASLAWLLVSAETPQVAFAYLQELGKALGDLVQVRGPQAARLYKLSGRYRYQLLLKAETRAQLATALQEKMSLLPQPKDLMISLTLDPLAL